MELVADKGALVDFVEAHVQLEADIRAVTAFDGVGGLADHLERGGVPTLRPDLYPLGSEERAAACRVRVAVLSGGGLVSPEPSADELLAAGISRPGEVLVTWGSLEPGTTLASGAVVVELAFPGEPWVSVTLRREDGSLVTVDRIAHEAVSS